MPPHVIDIIQDRIRSGGRIVPLPVGDGLGVFDTDVIQKINPENFEGLVLPRYLPDILVGRHRPEVSWEDVRVVLARSLRTASTPQALEAMYRRMRARAAHRQGPREDLTWLCQDIVVHGLLPSIVDGLRPAEERALLRDLQVKFGKLLVARGLTRLERLRHWRHEAVAGLAVRRVLADRRSGARPPQQDLAQAILGLFDRVGMVGAAYLVTTVLTAISGAPGSVASCVLFELLTRPEWRSAVSAELGGLSVEELCASPARRAPVTHRFIREVLRLWSFPLVGHRPVRRELDVAGVRLRPGDIYILSSYVTHRDPAVWSDPETFDPDRWRDERDQAPTASFVPFGWAPRACVGATLGYAQLFLLARLLTVDFTVTDLNPAASIELISAAVPRRFEGAVASVTP